STGAGNGSSATTGGLDATSETRKWGEVGGIAVEAETGGRPGELQAARRHHRDLPERDEADHANEEEGGLRWASTTARSTGSRSTRGLRSYGTDSATGGRSRAGTWNGNCVS